VISQTELDVVGLMEVEENENGESTEAMEVTPVSAKSVSVPRALWNQWQQIRY